ncbi:MAG: hypothetical protein A2W80_12060 [Candidatus Riflebacteria bacterium GWC2_50_8]|nr:MAG: hypothetical protein A2W80_12060 [Candidatus Riflebacteria bacterium GWC2_50_8]
MHLSESISQIKQAFKANIKPGAILWLLMVVFFVAYATNTAFSTGLGKVSALKISVGYPFSFGVYVLFAALMPEILKIIFFQKGKATAQNLRNLIFVGLLFGVMGILTDIFYGYQARWFGEETGLRTLFLKAFVDQGLYSPVANFLLVSIFFVRENGFSSKVFKRILTARFAFVKVLPVVVAGWCVWIPGVMLVYSMPTALQLPVASLILCFWVLIFSFVAEQRPAPAREQS